MRSGTFARAAGFWALIGGLLHVLSIGYLAKEFNYPSVLTQHARDVLPMMLEGGSTLRLMWIFLAIAPYSYIPMAVGAYTALKPYGRATTRIALMFGSLSAIATSLGQFRWASFHHELAHAWRISSPSQQTVIAAVFDGVNSLFGLFISGFVGEHLFALFSLLISATVLHGGPFPRWFGRTGVVLSIVLTLLAWRWAVDPSLLPMLAFVQNLVMLFWLVLFGLIFLIHARRYDEGRFRTM